jgi:hypothetical protein
MAQSGTLSASNWHADVDGIRSALQSHLDALAGRFQNQLTLDKRSITTATPLSNRSIVFVPNDDCDLLALDLEAATSAGTSDCRAKLIAVVDGGAEIENRLPAGADAPVVTLSTVGTTVVSDRKRYYDANGRRPGLLAGTPYRLEVEATAAGTFALLRATLVLGKRLRR